MYCLFSACNSFDWEIRNPNRKKEEKGNNECEKSAPEIHDYAHGAEVSLRPRSLGQRERRRGEDAQRNFRKAFVCRENSIYNGA